MEREACQSEKHKVVRAQRSEPRFVIFLIYRLERPHPRSLPRAGKNDLPWECPTASCCYFLSGNF